MGTRTPGIHPLCPGLGRFAPDFLSHEGHHPAATGHLVFSEHQFHECTGADQLCRVDTSALMLSRPTRADGAWDQDPPLVTDFPGSMCPYQGLEPGHLDFMNMHVLTRREFSPAWVVPVYPNRPEFADAPHPHQRPPPTPSTTAPPPLT